MGILGRGPVSKLLWNVSQCLAIKANAVPKVTSDCLIKAVHIVRKIGFTH